MDQKMYDAMAARAKGDPKALELLAQLVEYERVLKRLTEVETQGPNAKLVITGSEARSLRRGMMLTEGYGSMTFFQRLHAWWGLPHRLKIPGEAFRQFDKDLGDDDPKGAP